MRRGQLVGLLSIGGPRYLCSPSTDTSADDARLSSCARRTESVAALQNFGCLRLRPVRSSVSPVPVATALRFQPHLQWCPPHGFAETLLAQSGVHSLRADCIHKSQSNYAWRFPRG